MKIIRFEDMNIENHINACGCYDDYILFYIQRNPEWSQKLKLNEFCDGQHHFIYRNGTITIKPFACSHQANKVQNDRLKALKIRFQIKKFSELDKEYSAECPETLKIIKKYCDFDGKSNLLLTGTTGCGKTVIAKAILYYFAEQNYKCSFITINELKNFFQDIYSQDCIAIDKAKIKINFLLNLNYLVIDELGGIPQIGYQRENFINDFQIFLDQIENKCIKIIYTTNLAIKDIGEAVGDKNLSRILNNTKLIKFPNFDYRIKKFQNLSKTQIGA